MATLNSTETEKLQKVVAVLEAVMRDGYDPTSLDSELMGKLLSQSRDSVRTIISVKGYFPA